MATGTYRVAFSMALADSEMSAPIRHLNNVAVWMSIAATFGGLGLIVGSFPRRPRRRHEAVAA